MSENEEYTFVIREKELAGFGLAGYKQLNGTIKLIGTNRYIAEWPSAIPFMGATYTLEDVSDGSVNEVTGEIWQNAEYC